MYELRKLLLEIAEQIRLGEPVTKLNTLYDMLIEGTKLGKVNWRIDTLLDVSFAVQPLDDMWVDVYSDGEVYIEGVCVGENQKLRNAIDKYLGAVK